VYVYIFWMSSSPPPVTGVLRNSEFAYTNRTGRNCDGSAVSTALKPTGMREIVPSTGRA
jgi:hypothetical protein